MAQGHITPDRSGSPLIIIVMGIGSLVIGDNLYGEKRPGGWTKVVSSSALPGR